VHSDQAVPLHSGTRQCNRCRLAKTIDYIYGYWLPNSTYTRGPGDDGEWFEDVVSFEDPALRSQYVLSIRLRGEINRYQTGQAFRKTNVFLPGIS